LHSVGRIKIKAQCVKINTIKNNKSVKKLLNTSSIKFLLQVLKKQNLESLESLELTPENLEVLKSHSLENWAYENIPAWRPALKNRRMFLLQRSMAQLSALVKIKKAFEAEKIDFIVLKGLPLSMLLYNDYTVRQCGDIDIFIRPEKILEAHQCLIQLGYVIRVDHPVLKGGVPAILSAEKDLGYFHPETHVVLECHWRLMRNPRLVGDCFENFLARVDKILLGPETFNFFNQEDLLIYLSMHGANHHWERLSWLWDISILIKHMLAIQGFSHAHQLDWEKIIQRAQFLNALRSLLLALVWCEILFGDTMPALIKNLWDQDKNLQRLMRFQANYLQEKFLTKIGLIADLNRLVLYPTWKDKWLFYHVRSFSHYRLVLRWRLPFPRLCLALCYFLEPVIILGRLFKYTGQGLVRFFHRFI